MTQARGTLLATLLFTDIVGSTQLAEELGDRRWRELLARHHTIVRRELKRFGGRELDTAGDGFFAAFSKPAEPVRAACAISDALRDLGIEVRSGLHVGEAEIFGPKLSGVAVHIAARTMAEAGPGEVLVTGVLKDLVPGSGFQFDDRGMHSLKGVPADWHLYAVTSVDDVPRAPVLGDAAARERRDRIRPPRVPRRARRPMVVTALTTGLLVAIVAASVGLTRHRAAAPRPASASRPYMLVHIDPATRMAISSTSLPDRAGGVVVAEGSVWVMLDDDRVLRIQPATGRAIATIGVGNDPTAIAAGDGAVWVANKLSDSVSRIDPTTDKLVATVPLGGQPWSVAAGDVGVWVSWGPVAARLPNVTTVSRIDPATNQASDDRPVTGSCPAVMAVGPDSGWALAADGALLRIDPSTGRFLKLATLGEIPAGAIADAETVWLSIDGTPAQVLPADLFGHAGTPIPVGDTTDPAGRGCGTIGLAEGYGRLWVTNADSHSISVIATGLKQVIGEIALPGKPTGIAFGPSGVWVTVDARKASR